MSSDLDELLRRSEAADAQRDEDPAAGVRTFGRVLTQLLADVTVDLVPETQRRRLTRVRRAPPGAGGLPYLRAGLRIPLPMMKWSFSRLDVGRSSNMLLPCKPYSPSFRRFVT